MEHLDARLGTIAAMVPRCRAVADIGCDHGLLVAALLEGGRCDYGIAADINPMPLEKARQELTRRGLLAQSECRLTNGLCGIAPVGVDVVVIAGMGGELIADILSRWDYTENPAITYLLQPMTRPVHLRQWLYTHRFTLQEERCCRANGKLYTVLQAQYTGCATEETPAALYFGALDLENDPLAGEYREQVLGRLQRRITGRVEARPAPERDAGRAEAPTRLRALQESETGAEGRMGRSPARRRRATRALLVCFGFAETGCAPWVRGLCPHAHFCRGQGRAGRRVCGPS